MITSEGEVRILETINLRIPVFADIAQSVERVLSKHKVLGSIPSVSIVSSYRRINEIIYTASSSMGDDGNWDIGCCYINALDSLNVDIFLDRFRFFSRVVFLIV